MPIHKSPTCCSPTANLSFPCLIVLMKLCILKTVPRVSRSLGVSPTRLVSFTMERSAALLNPISGSYKRFLDGLPPAIGGTDVQIGPRGLTISAKLASKDLTAGKSRAVAATWKLMPQNDTYANVEPIAPGVPLDSAFIVHSSSPCGRQLLTFRKDDKQRLILELWADNKLHHAIVVDSKLHGDPIAGDGWFSCAGNGGVAWSEDGLYVAYTAEAPPLESPPLFETKAGPAAPANSSSAGASSSAPAAPTATATATAGLTNLWSREGGGVPTGAAREVWGERYEKVRCPRIYTACTASGRVMPLPGIPADAGFTVGQAAWAPLPVTAAGPASAAGKGKGKQVFGRGPYLLAYTAWPHSGRRLGQVYCFNRPCFVAVAHVTDALAELTKPATATTPPAAAAAPSAGAAAPSSGTPVVAAPAPPAAAVQHAVVSVTATGGCVAGGWRPEIGSAVGEGLPCLLARSPRFVALAGGSVSGALSYGLAFLAAGRESLLTHGGASEVATATVAVERSGAGADSSSWRLSAAAAPPRIACLAFGAGFESRVAGSSPASGRLFVGSLPAQPIRRVSAATAAVAGAAGAAAGLAALPSLDIFVGGAVCGRAAPIHVKLAAPFAAAGAGAAGGSELTGTATVIEPAVGSAAAPSAGGASVASAASLLLLRPNPAAAVGEPASASSAASSSDAMPLLLVAASSPARPDALELWRHDSASSCWRAQTLLTGPADDDEDANEDEDAGAAAATAAASAVDASRFKLPSGLAWVNLSLEYTDRHGHGHGHGHGDASASAAGAGATLRQVQGTLLVPPSATAAAAAAGSTASAPSVATPLAVVPHGGPHSSFNAEWIAPYAWLATLGLDRGAGTTDAAASAAAAAAAAGSPSSLPLSLSLSPIASLLVNYAGSTGWDGAAIAALPGRAGSLDSDETHMLALAALALGGDAGAAGELRAMAGPGARLRVSTAARKPSTAAAAAAATSASAADADAGAEVEFVLGGVSASDSSDSGSELGLVGRLTRSHGLALRLKPCRLPSATSTSSSPAGAGDRGGRGDLAGLVIVGGSHGGFLAGHAVARFPGHYAAACLRNPVTNLASLLATSDIADWTLVEGCGVGAVWAAMAPEIRARRAAASAESAASAASAAAGAAGAGGASGGAGAGSTAEPVPEALPPASPASVASSSSLADAFASVPAAADFAAFAGALQAALRPSAPLLRTLLAASPIAAVDRVTAPCLTVLGLSDKRVPPSQGIEWHYALRSRGVASE